MSKAVVYYSLSGNTMTAAEYLAGKLDATLIRLEEDTSRRGFIGSMENDFQATTRRASRVVGTPWADAADHQELYLLTPIWASNGTPAMNTFLEQAEFAGKSVTVVTFQADRDGKGSGKTHQHIAGIVTSKGASVTATYAFHSAPPGKHAGEEHIQSQVANIV